MKVIKGFENYGITEDGQVWSFPKNGRKGKFLKPIYDYHRYTKVSLYDINGKIYNRTIHRLVAENFIPNPDNLPQVNHKNGLKDDNKIDNLEWVTYEENRRHLFDVLNYSCKGDKNPNSKLTQEQIDFIRSHKWKYGEQKKYAELFGVHVSSIQRIKNCT